MTLESERSERNLASGGAFWRARTVGDDGVEGQAARVSPPVELAAKSPGAPKLHQPEDRHTIRPLSNPVDDLSAYRSCVVWHGGLCRASPFLREARAAAAPTPCGPLQARLLAGHSRHLVD